MVEKEKQIFESEINMLVESFLIDSEGISKHSLHENCQNWDGLF